MAKTSKEKHQPNQDKLEDRPDTLIANIAEASKNARSLYIVFVGLLAYSALTVFSTDDRRIVLNEAARLPVINLDVSLNGFFILAPILSIFMFVYFQLYLLKLKRLLEDLRTNFKSIKEDREIYPWMINFSSELGTGFLGHTQSFIVTFSLWLSLPIVLMLFAIWYLKKHDPILSRFVGIMPLLGTLIVLAFWAHYEQSADYTLQLKNSHLRSFFKKHMARIWMLAVVLVFESCLFFVFIPLAMRGERIVGTWPAVDLSHQNLTNKEGQSVYLVNLRGAKLQGADFTGAILERADLREANLEGAKLEDANLKSADISHAILRRANLRRAILDNAKLQFADLSWSTLEGARFTGAILDSTDFGGANLPANFDRSQLRTAKLNVPALRKSRSDNLLMDAVKSMITENNLFDSSYNPSGSGFSNQFSPDQIDGVIIDHASGRMWQRSGSLIAVTYSEAQAYVDSLNKNQFAGFNDWRLPTLEEAMSLMEPKRQGDLYIDPVFDRNQPWIWTADKTGAGAAWYVNFNDGNCYRNDLNLNDYVRAVR